MNAIVGYSQLDLPGSRNRQLYLRNGFIHTIEDHAPQVVVALTTILPRLGNVSLPTSFTLFSRECRFRPQAELLLIANLIDQWAINFNLTVRDEETGLFIPAVWCRRFAYESLLIWKAGQFSRREAIRFGLMRLSQSATEPISDPTSPPGEWPSYRPLRTTRLKYLNELRAVLGSTLSHPTIPRRRRRKFVEDIVRLDAEPYCVIVERHYRARGCIDSRSQPEQEVKMIRAVRYQTDQNQSFNRLALDSGRDVASIKESVDEMLADIGLTPRSAGRSGRPRGRKNSPRISR